MSQIPTRNRQLLNFSEPSEPVFPRQQLWCMLRKMCILAAWPVETVKWHAGGVPPGWGSHGHVLGEHVWDVVPGVSVQALLQSLLVQVVSCTVNTSPVSVAAKSSNGPMWPGLTDEAHATAQDKDPVQCSDLHEFIGLVPESSSTFARETMLHLLTLMIKVRNCTSNRL